MWCRMSLCAPRDEADAPGVRHVARRPAIQPAPWPRATATLRYTARSHPNLDSASARHGADGEYAAGGEQVAGGKRRGTGRSALPAMRRPAYVEVWTGPTRDREVYRAGLGNLSGKAIRP